MLKTIVIGFFEVFLKIVMFEKQSRMRLNTDNLKIHQKMFNVHPDLNITKESNRDLQEMGRVLSTLDFAVNY